MAPPSAFGKAAPPVVGGDNAIEVAPQAPSLKPVQPEEYNPIEEAITEYFTKNFNTKLDFWDEVGYQTWVSELSMRDQRPVNMDVENYDLRGLYKLYDGRLPSEGHMPDEFKKPNHPTFSQDSLYSGNGFYEGGFWTPDGSTFYPGEITKRLYPQDVLEEYFATNEPGVVLQYDWRDER